MTNEQAMKWSYIRIAAYSKHKAQIKYDFWPRSHTLIRPLSQFSISRHQSWVPVHIVNPHYITNYINVNALNVTYWIVMLYNSMIKKSHWFLISMINALIYFKLKAFLEDSPLVLTFYLQLQIFKKVPHKRRGVKHSTLV